MFYSQKGPQFLIDQGYAFKVISRLDGMDKAELDFETLSKQLGFLEDVLAPDESEATERSENDADECELSAVAMGGGFDIAGTRRKSSLLAVMSGVKGIRYSEFERVGPTTASSWSTQPKKTDVF